MQQVIIKPLAKGQITIPVSFRRELGIKENTLFQAELKEDGVFLKPISLDWKEKYIRQFSDEEIKGWLEEDKMDKKTLQKLKKYFK
ncbi:hypothetical protein A3D83_03390 [Candidatus Daviesbacteria bacterium RIFCSPHIGHO2_02_FULL_41_10]|uniref:SpoVT-AbrB domain-containing protein n=1 Tax=Candidatus Daviesbacteria bacterium RIFCSPHIGHO2_02_FULL_41_10 TaxID=1797774 RepID=A0A1F5JZC2_9BACT|nr:MAG: hypothetical protein A3D83_03390 [Candidatus Daviesbacteria bacterium RIFCSPHIGHO2_02_FULL_41_10]